LSRRKEIDYKPLKINKNGKKAWCPKLESYAFANFGHSSKMKRNNY